MKRIVSFIVVLAVAMCGMTQVMAQKSITKEAKKVEREIKKQERLAQDAVEAKKSLTPLYKLSTTNHSYWRLTTYNR